MRIFSAEKLFQKTARKRPFLRSLILVVSCFFSVQLAAQENTVWSLNPVISHARTSAGSPYPITFTVHHLDAKGGHVQARATKPGKPECFALFDYDWVFSSPLDVLRQDDVFKVKIVLTANPGTNCYPELDPQLKVQPVSGTFTNTELVGRFTNAEKALILWHPTPSNLGSIGLQRRGPRAGGDIFHLKVDDTRTSHKSKQNAMRGAFKIQMGYRGAIYEAYYIFSAKALGIKKTTSSHPCQIAKSNPDAYTELWKWSSSHGAGGVDRGINGYFCGNKGFVRFDGNRFESFICDDTYSVNCRPNDYMYASVTKRISNPDGSVTYYYKRDDGGGWNQRVTIVKR